ncbi:hypothetical protein LCGC14_1236040 [marine sediment metagenome]|uniref:Uncharacterized protein n=1 Tax=marine sediment metagenome TaxID=412755 RepID=A0A0F9L793_9ZZZZ
MGKEEIIREFKITNLPADDEGYIDLSSEVTKDDNNLGTDDYSPYENYSVLNDGATDIKLFINNQKSGRKISSSMVWEHNNAQVSRIRYKNLSSSAVANFTLIFDNRMTVEKILLEILKTLREK